MFNDPNPYSFNCPSREILEIIGGKWAILIVCALRNGAVRTGNLKRTVGGISQKMLTQTLRDLRSNGIVERQSYGEVPPRVEYRLTRLGYSLGELAAGMEQWVVENYSAILASRASALA